MKKIMKLNKFYLLIAMITMVFACQKDDDTSAATPISVSFEVNISQQNTLRVIANNTSTGTSGLNSYWQFTENGEIVPDENGPETYLYTTSGEYMITLTVEAPEGDIQVTKTVLITGEDYVPPALKDATDEFSVGMAVQANRMTGGHNEVMVREFNNLTAEYEMKMNITYPSEGTYNFGPSDAIVDYGVANGMDIHGHALIWHNATPDWIENFVGTNTEFEDMIEDYITTVVTRYSGKVRSWDVVNEAVEDGSNQLRNSVFKIRMGDNYIEKCYQFARNADPNVLLFYNDYNVAIDAGKRAAIFSIVDDLAAQNLIDGVGAQMHIDINFPTTSDIQSVVDGTVGRGLKMHFSELDIRLNPDNAITALTEEREIAQENKVREVVELYDAMPTENKFAITIWGLRDNESWLIDFWGNPEWPLFYDSNYDVKKAHAGFLEALEE